MQPSSASTHSTVHSSRGTIVTAPAAAMDVAPQLRARPATEAADGLLQMSRPSAAAGSSAAALDDTLQSAVARGDSAAMQALLLAGAGVDHADEDGFTALMMAAVFGRDSMIRVLMHAGAAVDQVWPGDGSAPLAQAAANGKAEAMRALIQWGASVSHCDVNGHTALITASRHNHRDIVLLLVRAGAAIDHADRFGLTALMNAAQCGCPRSVEALLQAGADYKVKSNAGDTALSFAMARNHEHIIRLLREKGARR